VQIFHRALAADPSRSCLGDAEQRRPRKLALPRAAVQRVEVFTRLTEDTRASREDLTPALRVANGVRVDGLSAAGGK
jgi:hypothetical protein